MKKKRAIGNFIVLTILVIVCLVFSFVSFNIPGTTSIFKGFLRSIPKSVEFSHGVTATYNIEMADYFDGEIEEAVDKTVNRLQKLLKADYSEFIIAQTGENQIKVTVPGETFNSQDIVGEIEFSTSTPEALSELTESEIAEKMFLNGSHIKSITYRSYNGTPGIYFDFKKSGIEAFENAISSESTVYIYTNKDYSSYKSAVQVDSEVASYGFMFLSGGNLKTKSIATKMAAYFSTGLIGTNMELVGSYDRVENAFKNNVISNQTLFVSILAIAVVCIILISSFAFLYARYKEFGLVAMLSMMFFVVINIIIFSLIENLFLSFSTLFAFILCYILTFVAHLIIMEKIKKEYASGAKFIGSFKNGYKKSILTIVDIYAPIWASMLLTIFVSVNAIYSFAYFSTISLLVGLFTSLLMFRWFIALYLNINNSKSKKVNFVREESKNEN